MGMIDLHSHVLPGIDDGPDAMDGALELARAAAADGTRTLAATPHLRADHPAVRPAELEGRTDALRAALAAAGVGIEIVQAGEVDVLWARSASSDDLRSVSFGRRGHDLLVETPYGNLAPVFEDLLFGIAAQGYRILLAHPERSRTFRAAPRRLAAFVEVTAGSLAEGSRRSPVRRYALALVTEGLAHVIASDAHGGHIGRASLSAGVKAAARATTPGRARWMASDAPAAILAGDPLPPVPTGRAARRGFMRRG
jgi:protein-tyrosine phosphatase